MPASPARVLVLGVDAADPALLRAWAADGTLPNIGSLFRRGLSGNTRSMEGFYVGATWPSFYTGVNPARHGFHYLTQLKPGSYQYYQPADEAFVKYPPFWTRLSEAGKRVAVVDVPLSRIDPDINGLQIVEWGGHDGVFGYQTWPAGLRDELTRSLGRHGAGHDCDAGRRTAADYAELIDYLVGRVESRAALTRHLLGRGGWDLFIQVFSEAHCAGHQCWHLHDPELPTHDAAVAAVTGDPIRRVYRAIDAAIGEVLKDAGDALVILVSAHGMSHWFGAGFLLPEILVRLGVTQPDATPPQPPLPTPPWRAAARWVWRRLPPPLQSRLSPLKERIASERDDSGAVEPLGVDAAKSLCFPVRNGLTTGGIRLNLIGREPSGTVAPGAEADALCAKLAASLLQIVDERTGSPLVARVVRTAELYQGKHLGDLPDLLVDWNDSAPVGNVYTNGGAAALVRARSPEIGVVEGSNSYGRTGEHRIGGLFIAAGPGVRAGQLDRIVSTVDFAPTFARLLGVELPDSDGRPIPELLSAFTTLG